MFNANSQKIYRKLATSKFHWSAGILPNWDKKFYTKCSSSSVNCFSFYVCFTTAMCTQSQAMTVLPSCPTSIMWVVWLQLNSNMQKHFLKRLTQHNQRAWVFLLRCLRDCLAHQCIHFQAPLYHSQYPHDMVRHKKSWSSVFQRVRLIISKQFFCIDIYPRIECTFCKDYFAVKCTMISQPAIECKF